MKLDILGFLTRLIARPYAPATPPSKMVAIVVPLSNRVDLLPEEAVSMSHLLHFLGSYDKYFVSAPGISRSLENCKVVTFHHKFFGSQPAHNHLLLWPGFYRTFRDYEYILVYHLDSLVLSDEITQWCSTGLDYIGAPWIVCPDTPWVKEARVGNGGFTLMKVESILKVLHNRHRQEPATYWLDMLLRNNSVFRPLFWFLRLLQPIFPNSRIINRPLEDLRKSEQPDIHGCNNDFFWSFHATQYLPEFKIASVEEGLRFAFEAAPRLCFEMNHGRMPFGCHAWTKFDPDFWAPHLLTSDQLVAAP